MAKRDKYDSMVEEFRDDTMRSQFPQHDVADHEVYMSFSGDSEGLAFREWWEEEGASLFVQWIAQNKRL